MVIAAALILGSVPAIAAMMAPPSISVVSPLSGATVRGRTIPVTVAIHNFDLECANVGKRGGPGNLD